MYQGEGRVIKGVGGLYTVRLDAGTQPLDGATVSARGRGILRRRGALLVGDRVRVCYEESAVAAALGTAADSEIHSEAGTASAAADLAVSSGIAPGTESGSGCGTASGAPASTPLPSSDGSGIAICEILPRRSALIRPPMANLDVLFVTAAAASPAPAPETLDKLLCIAEYNRIEPVLVVTKTDMNAETARGLSDIYRTAGFPVFPVCALTGEGLEPLRAYIRETLPGKIAAFSGASGVGQSTLLNCIFPELSLATDEVSRRIARGKNTTRSVELYPLSAAPDCGYLADTPGFSMLDFARFDFFGKDDLPGTFREFSPYIGHCRYKKCTHTREDGCAILAAVREGKIPASRHKSYTALFEVLRKKNPWG